MCRKIASDGKESEVEMAYIRGSQIQFIILPDMLAKAPFFNRIKMWRKFKGHAVFGAGGLIGPRGQSAAIIQKSQNRRLSVQGGPPGAPVAGGLGAPRGPYGPGGGNGDRGGPGAYGPPPGQQQYGADRYGGGAYGGGGRQF